MAQLQLLEDAWVDVLVQRAISAGFPAIIATCARAAIDLNRAVDDIDPAMVADPERAGPIYPGRRSDIGLGLFPKLLPGTGPLWRSNFAWAELSARIDEDYWPYHNAITNALALRRKHFGGAVLLDMHSMPPLRKSGRDLGIDIVFGTLHGQSSGDWLVTAIEQAAHDAGFSTCRDTPYAGGHILAKYGRPAVNQHAVQIELSRALYLDADGHCDDAGASRVQSLVLTLAQAALAAWKAHGLLDASGLSIAAE